MEKFIHQELEPILQPIVILSPELVQFAGEPAVQVSSAPAFIPGHPLPENPLVRALQQILYNRCYAHRMESGPPNPPAPDAQLAARLSASNRSREHWDPGWKIYLTMSTGQIYVSKGERQRSAMPGEYIANTGPGMTPQVGSWVMLRVDRESHVLQPGFYFMFSETLTDVWDEHNLLRFYFHCTPQVVAPLVEHLTIELNQYLVPYRMKALSDAALYTRTDAMVLYCAKRYFDIVSRILLLIPEWILSRLESSVPLFSKPLLPGIGVAEDPNTGESFGMHRCRLVAEGIVDAWVQGQQSVPARLRSVAARFAMNGFQLDAPHLNSGCLDPFTMPFLEKNNERDLIAISGHR
jgi:hypothetical protein